MLNRKTLAKSIVVILFVGVAGIIFSLGLSQFLGPNIEEKEEEKYYDQAPTSEVDFVEIVEVTVAPNSEHQIEIPDGISLVTTDLPSFIELSPSNDILKLSPKKTDISDDYLVVGETETGRVGYLIDVEPTPIDFQKLRTDLITYLGPVVLKQYGIYVHDLGRGESINLNGNRILPPASMAKTTIAMLVLRDIDAGKYTLDKKITIKANLKHTSSDTLGSLAVGTRVPMSKFLEELIIVSSNTAWYHLHDFLGGRAVVNKRTTKELGVNPLFLDPHISTANQFGKLFTGLYEATTLSQESRDYLIDLMQNATEWNRGGVGQGLPKGVEFANKIGYLWTDTDINFVDSAIIWGKNTDYVLIVLNKDVDWVIGKQRLKEISEIVYKFLDK